LKKNVLNSFIEKLVEFPLWMKQVIFLRLYSDLKTLLSADFINFNEEEVFHLYVPVMSYVGKAELEERVKGLDTNMYNFLGCLDDEMTIMEIALNNFWTLEEVAKYFVFAMEQDFLKAPIPLTIATMAGFMAGKYRTGEYFKRIGKINVDQLELTIRRQKELKEQGQKAMIAEVMIELGFITEKDTKSLLIIKNEAQKRFILDTSIIPAGVTTNDSKYLAQIDALKKQNLVLKAQLNKLLGFFKKNANK
jgi:hypothetical protein